MIIIVEERLKRIREGGGKQGERMGERMGEKGERKIERGTAIYNLI